MFQVVSDKLISMWRILRARSFILITNNEAVVYADFKGYDGLMQSHAIRVLNERLAEVAAELDTEFGTAVKKKGGKKNAGN